MQTHTQYKFPLGNHCIVFEISDLNISDFRGCYHSSTAGVAKGPLTRTAKSSQVIWRLKIRPLSTDNVFQHLDDHENTENES